MDRITHKDLGRMYPGVFGRTVKPLSIGIFDDLLQALGPTTQPGHLKALLGQYTRRRAYQAAIADGGPRYALDGSEKGAVSPEEQTHAKTILTTRAKERRDRAMFLKAVEASGLSHHVYAITHGIPLAKAQSDFQRATNEREVRRERRRVLVEKYEASGLTVDEFAAKFGITPTRLASAISKIKST